MHLARRLVFILSAVMILTASLPAFAQQKTLGFVVGYPASIGVDWRINDRFSLRGDGTIRWSSAEQEQGIPVSTSLGLGSTLDSSAYSVRSHYDTKTTAGTIGIAAIINVSKADRFSMYVAPRMAWSLSKATAHVTYEFNGIPPPFGDLARLLPSQTIETTEHTPTASLVAGAIADVHERFKVFAEAGAGYTWGTLSPLVVGATSAPSTRTRAIGVRSGVGAIIYF